MLTYLSQDYEGALSFTVTTDAWSSPNHCTFVAVTVHFEQNRHPVCLLLDMVEVVCSHSGTELTLAFASILREFGIENKGGVGFVQDACGIDEVLVAVPCCHIQ